MISIFKIAKRKLMNGYLFPNRNQPYDSLIQDVKLPGKGATTAEPIPFAPG
jgi:hypothetical protein